MKNPGLNFLKFAVTNKLHFLEKRNTSLGIPKFLEIPYRGIPFHLIFFLEFQNFWLNVFLLRNLTIFRNVSIPFEEIAQKNRGFHFLFTAFFCDNYNNYEHEFLVLFLVIL